MTQLDARRAIQSAVKGDWDNARLINEQILSINPKDIDALNRLARALCELGHIKKALQTSKEVLKIEPSNTIAKRSLAKWEHIKDGTTSNRKCITSGNAFIEEPGKTKTINLINLGSHSVVGTLEAGDEVILKYSGHRISVCTSDGKHIGRIPDDLSVRLKLFISNGASYTSHIKSISDHEIKVFVREIVKPTNVAKNSFSIY